MSDNKIFFKKSPTVNLTHLYRTLGRKPMTKILRQLRELSATHGKTVLTRRTLETMSIDFALLTVLLSSYTSSTIIIIY